MPTRFIDPRTGMAAMLAALAFGSAVHAQTSRTDTAQKGSLLILPNIEVRWNAAGQLTQDAFIELANDFPNGVSVLIYYVNGDPPLAAAGAERAHPGWNSLDMDLALTQDQPIYWSVSAEEPRGSLFTAWEVLDPGVPPGRPDPEGGSDRVLRGFIVMWAVNANREQINFNQLSAHVTVVNYAEQSAWRYSAAAFQADAAVPSGNVVGTPGIIQLNGVQYEVCPSQLLFEFLVNGTTLPGIFASPPRLTDTDLTLMPAQLDLRQDSSGPVTTMAFVDIWDMNEIKFTGTRRCMSCWDQTLLSNYAAPNAFLPAVMTTDMGKARIDGLASVNCAGSVNAALLGVAAQLVDFAPTPGAQRDIAGVTLAGAGVESATIRYDLPAPRKAVPRDRIRPTPPEGSIALVPGVNSRAKANIKGSLLIFPDIELRWDPVGNLRRDTYVELFNDNVLDVGVRLYFVNGDAPIPPTEPGWNFACGRVDLTHDHPTYWSAATGLPAGVGSFINLDPGPPPGRLADDGSGERILCGFLLAWAVNASGEEIHWNHLTGVATVVDVYETSAWSYSPTAVIALDQGGAVAPGDATGTPYTLNLNGVEFAQMYAQLLMKFFSEGTSPLSGAGHVVTPANELTMLVVPADLRAASTGPTGTKADFTLWNENEVQFTGTFRCVTCWDQEFLSNYAGPNHFLVANLQTDAGKARFSGLNSGSCAGSVAAPLLGVLRSRLSFNAAGIADIGEHLVGAGSQSATIQVDATCGNPFRRPGDGDNDGDVDLGDVAGVFRCFGANPPPGCLPLQFADFDVDEDDDVDVDDYRVIQEHLIGPQ